MADENLTLKEKDDLLKESFERWKAKFPENAKKVDAWTEQMRQTDPGYQPWRDRSFLDPTSADHDRLYKYIDDLRASPLERARRMGFDVDRPVYHGSPHPDIKEFKPSKTGMFGPGVYTAINPEEASKYAIRNNIGETGTPTVYPLLTRGRILDRRNYKDLWDLYKEIDPSTPDIDFSGEWWKDPKKAELYEKVTKKIDTLREAQKKGTYIEDMVRESKIFTGIDDNGNRIIFDPKNIRSRFAEFDPAKSESADLSAFAGKKVRFPSVGKMLGSVGTVSDIADITSGDLVEGALGLGSNVLGRAAPYSGILRPEKTVSEELESRQMQEAKERMESEDEAKYKREALKRLMSKMEE